MRVTKLIRDYVKESVDKVYPTDETLYPELFEAERKLEEFCKVLASDINKMIADKTCAFRLENGIPDDFLVERNGYSQTGLRVSTRNSEMAKEYQKRVTTNLKKKEEAIKNILLSLELGAGRETLEAMLADLS